MAIVTKAFKAKGMQCHSCEQIMQRAAKKIDGVEELKISYETEKGEITFDDEKTNINEIFKAIEDKGYDCVLSKHDSSKHDDSHPRHDESKHDESKHDESKHDENKHHSKHKDSKHSGKKGTEDAEESVEIKGSQIFGWLFGIVGILLIGFFVLRLVDGAPLPELSQNMGYGLLFLVGLITGFHCVAMCGGFVVSYTAKGAKENVKPHWLHLAYAAGKLISYTLIGALFGLLGSFIAFTPTMRGVVGILAGIFLVIYGLSMMNVFPFLRKFRIKSPGFINKFLGKQSASSGPFVTGLLNGLMIACGPLQALYIMAAGTGSAVEGAKLLFIFALGTLPVMIGFGYIASYISGKMKSKLMLASGIIILILGLVMLNNGLTLTGSGYDFGSVVRSISGTGPSAQTSGSGSGQAASGNIAVLKDGYQEIRMDVLRSGWSPNTFVLKKGVPVRWIINGKELNGCNSGIQVPKYGLEFDIKQGEQVIEFTPDKSEVVSWSCWMGMIRGTFIVKDDITNDSALNAEVKQVVAAAPKGASCGGGCGCGG